MTRRSLSAAAVRLRADHVERRTTMKYMLLIHQGDTPTPRSPEEWARLTEDEQKAVYAAYQAINETPGVSPGVQMEAPELATTVRVENGRTLTRTLRTRSFGLLCFLPTKA